MHLDQIIRRSLPAALVIVYPLQVAAAEPTIAGPSFTQGFRVVLALLLVLGLVFLLAAFLRKVNFIQPRGQRAISVQATLPLNSKEKLLLVQVGSEQILISQGHGNIRKLHTLEHPIDSQDSEIPVQEPGFQGLLTQLLDRQG